jgi:hypothetical protein
MSVSNRNSTPPRAPGAAVEELIAAVWAGRIFAGLCTAAGIYVAAVSLHNILAGQATGVWLLPCATGSLVAILSICVVFAPAGGAIPRRILGQRALAMTVLAAYAFVLLPLLGFLTGSVLLVLTLAMLYASNRVVVAAGGLAIAFAMWALFAYALVEPLPVGLLWR